jgi:alpha-tubulin suppressor-like RCC1 family protein
MIADVVRVLIAVAATACRYNEPIVGGVDAPIDSPVDSSDATACHALEVAAGSGHTCARLDDGSLWCWGANNKGQLGMTTQAMCGITPCNPTPQQVQVSTVDAMALGDRHTCVSTATGVYCWGANTEGEFGNGMMADSTAPVLIDARAGTTALVAGALQTCSLIGTGVQCSGRNQFGEVGDGTGMIRLNPTAALLSLVTVTKLGSGFNHVFAIADNGDLYGWGLNGNIQLDSAQPAAVFAPIRLAQSNVVQVAGGVFHTCALISDHHLECRGSNARGQIAQTTATNFAFTEITAITAPIDAVAAGGDQTCVLTEGAVKCFGDHYGATPVPITLPRPATGIFAGNAHACAILDDGSVWCWGDNSRGQLGDGTTTSSQTTGRHALCR